jgi:para-aminobenzoate synthetase
VTTLLIDNYDSFTYNLFQDLSKLTGTPPIVIRNDEIGWDELCKLAFDNIVISPGPGRPENQQDFGICRRAILEAKVPILGVCLGHQGIAHAFGGRVVSAEPMHGRQSKVHHDASGLFRDIPTPFSAVRYHSLAVDGDLPDCLIGTAWTDDGLLMALQHRTRPIWGVQFHPESICSEHGAALLRNFLDLATAARAPERDRSLSAPSSRASEPSCRPLAYRRLPRLVDPEAAFHELYATSTHAFWLDSALVSKGFSRFSFMGAASGPQGAVLSYRSRERRLDIADQTGTHCRNESLFDFIKARTGPRLRSGADLPFDFHGGYVGYFGYELKQECGGDAAHESPLPDAMLLSTARFIAFDHLKQETYLVSADEDGEEADAWLRDTEARLARLAPLPDPLPQPLPDSPPHLTEDAAGFTLRHSRSAYIDRIRLAMNEIRAGESYEVCLTNALTLDAGVDLFRLYRILRRINQAPHAAFLKLGDLTVVSSSPERFLRVDRSGRVQAKPIKGTVRRAADAAEDAALAQWLRTDEKSRAENLMIVDLLRNDIGRVCEAGSVTVPRLMEIESYATVHQLVSTVEGQLPDHVHVVDCIRSCFPGGSMVGAPKIRTMQIIDRLEGEARGVYSGAIGYIGADGATDLSIVIRTIVAADDHLSIGVGGAIVALSDPEEEFEETMLKARSLLRAVALAAEKVR